jgi:hypothetical protein
MKLYTKVAAGLKAIQVAAIDQDHTAVAAHREAISKLLNNSCPWWGDILSVDLMFEDSTLTCLTLKVIVEESDSTKIDTYFVAAAASLICGLEVNVLDPWTADGDEDFIEYLEEAIYCFLNQQVPVCQ